MENRSSKLLRKILSVAAVLMLFTVVVAACGGQEPADEPAAEEETQTEVEQEEAEEPADEPAAEEETQPEVDQEEAEGDAAADMTEAEGEELVRNLGPDEVPADWQLPQDVGHVTNYLVHEWYQNLTAGEEVRAEDYGINFTINDANLDLQRSLAAVDDYLAQNIDVLVFTPVDENASAPTIQRVSGEGTPVVCESTWTDGCTTLIAIDDYYAGQQVGEWAGQYIQENMGGEARILDIGLPALSSTVARSDGFIAGVQSVLPDAEVVQRVDGQGLKDEAVQVAADALTAHPDVNVIFGINDDSALGGLQAYEAAGLDTSELLVVGFGCEGNACKSALEEGGPYKVSAGMFPEYQGRLIIDASIAAFNGAPLPDHIVAPTTPLTAENLGDYYPKSGDTWEADFEAISEIPIAGE